MDTELLTPIMIVLLAVASLAGIWAHFTPEGSWRQTVKHFALLVAIGVPAFREFIPDHPAKIPAVATLFLASFVTCVWLIRSDHIERQHDIRTSIGLKAGTEPGSAAIRDSELQDIEDQSRKVRRRGMTVAAAGGLVPALIATMAGHPLQGLAIGASIAALSAGMMYFFFRPVRPEVSTDEDLPSAEDADPRPLGLTASRPLDRSPTDREANSVSAVPLTPRRSSPGTR